MVFSSLFFILLFLPLNLLICGLMPDIKRKNKVMLAFSLVFYSWGGVRYLFLMLGMVFIAWITALVVEDERNRRRMHSAKLFMATGIAAMLMILGVFKYLGFLTRTAFWILQIHSEVAELVLPIGISFYTFQLISYVVDVYRGEVEAQKRYWMLLLYASLFHQCIAGPIVRYRHVARELEERRAKRSEIALGIRRFCVGLAKKAVLANGCAVVADAFLLSDQASLSKVSAMGLWLGMGAYMLQIYLDFSAYSDMAIGMGLMIGLHYEENFNYPYLARSIKDFWRRWHMSLGSFFRDYVYIPLGGSRGSEIETIRNLLVVWALTGLWHGASWNYVFWGLYFFVFLVLERMFLAKKLEQAPRAVSHLYALIVVFFGWVLFRFENTGNIFTVLAGMIGANGNGFCDIQAVTMFGNNFILLLVSGLACMPSASFIKGILFAFFTERKIPAIPVYVGEVVCSILLFALSVLALVGNSYNPFLYFQF